MIRMYQTCLPFLGPYDFHDAENTDGIVESSHKNGIYSLMQNVTEFSQSLEELIKSMSLNENKSRYGLESVNIKPQKDYLNMNPACCMCLNTLAEISVSAASLNEDINT